MCVKWAHHTHNKHIILYTTTKLLKCNPEKGVFLPTGTIKCFAMLAKSKFSDTMIRWI